MVGVVSTPATGAPALVAPDLLQMLDGESGLQAELMRFQFETTTRVCAGIEEIREELQHRRRLVAVGAEDLGYRLVASGTAPYPTPGVAALTDHARLSPRYPTVEVRVADVCLDVDTAVALVALVRALVTTALEEVGHRVEFIESLAGATVAAARIYAGGR